MFLEVKFEGGLGNQMFQYATARALCIENNISFLLLNPESYKHNSLGRSFALKHYKISGVVLTKGRVKQIFRSRTKLNQFFSAFSLHKNIQEESFNIQQLVDKTGFLTSIRGYWQSENYFVKIRELLLDEFVPEIHPPLPGWLSTHHPIVAIHVRRTDYLEESRYGFLGIDYYQQSIAYMRERLHNPTFVVFSDDMMWCRQNFKGENFVFLDEEEWKSDYLQLYLMSFCQHQVIANSSFSWWGAWLNKNPDKIVLRPEKPFKDTSLLYESHYPLSWHSIKNI